MFYLQKQPRIIIWDHRDNYSIAEWCALLSCWQESQLRAGKRHRLIIVHNVHGSFWSCLKCHPVSISLSFYLIAQCLHSDTVSLWTPASFLLLACLFTYLLTYTYWGLTCQYQLVLSYSLLVVCHEKSTIRIPDAISWCIPQSWNVWSEYWQTSAAECTSIHRFLPAIIVYNVSQKGTPTLSTVTLERINRF